MPFVQSFAEETLRFEECVANGPSTPASFPSILASRHFDSIEGLGIPPADKGGAVTLAEQLSSAGYDTAGFTDNHFASSGYNYDRGFDLIYDAPGSTEAGWIKQFVQSNLNKNGALFRTIETAYNHVDAATSAVTSDPAEYERAASLNDRALSWIDDRSPGDDWFVWLHYMDVHHPYEAPAAYQRQYLDDPVSIRRARRLARIATHHPEEMTDDQWTLLEKLYNAECAYVDDQFETIISELRERDVLEETAVVFTADHGELLGEHGRGGHPPEFWEDVICVPLLIRPPANSSLPAPKSICGQVRLLDIAPTITDAVDVKTPEEWTGTSALDVARGDVESREHAFGAVGREIDYRRTFVRRADGWKLMRIDRGNFLFDTIDTPDEAIADNRFGDGLTVETELTTTLEDHRDQMASDRTTDRAVEEDHEKVKQHLEDLGYK
jgi:arylsulfatase A-like enzyme